MHCKRNGRVPSVNQMYSKPKSGMLLFFLQKYDCPYQNYVDVQINQGKIIINLLYSKPLKTHKPKSIFQLLL